MSSKNSGRDNNSRNGVSVKDSPGAVVWTSDDLEPISYYGVLDGSGGSHPSTASHTSSTLDSNRKEAIDSQCILRSPPRDGTSVRSDIAFGDGDGTSGFVTESGELICIVQMLDMGPSGLFRARPNYPILPQKDHPFIDIVRGSKPGLGLNLIRDELFDHGSHQTDFVHDRWPRFSSSYPKLDVETQLCIKENRVIQHYILRSKDSIKVKFAFNAAINIDDPYMSSDLKGACNIKGGIFTTGATAVVLAGGAGGHVRFLASLFKDAQPTTLHLSVEEIYPLEFELPESDYFLSSAPTDTNSYKWACSLTQREEIAMVKGETRTMTGIYYFESERWSRDELYSLHMMPEKLLGTDIEKHRMKEEQFLRDFEAVKNSSPEISDQFVSDQSNILIGQGEAVPFSNWGGQATASQRLFGLEWTKSEVNDPLPAEVQAASDMQFECQTKFSGIRRNLSQYHGKISLSK